MIFNIKKHNTELYNTLLHLSRNEKFYKDINLSDTFETRIYPGVYSLFGYSCLV